MSNNKPSLSTKVATLALPTREAHVVASIWPGPKGMLLLLAELNLAPQTRQEFWQQINDEIERLWPEMKAAPGPADAVLEKLISALNNILLQHERLLGNPLTPRYQIIVAYLMGREVALANIGHIDAFVVSADKLANVVVNASKRPAKPSPIFDHLISGEITVGESLLLATPALTDYFSWERLRQLISGRPPGMALREIEKFMLQLKVHPPLGLICLQLTLSQETESTGASMAHLLQTKAQTASLLQPKLLAYLKSLMATPKREPQTSLPPPEVEPTVIKPTASRKRFTDDDALWFIRLARILRKLRWLTNRQSAKATIAWWLEKKHRQWLKLTPAKKTLLLLGLIILLAGSQSLINLGRRQLRATDSEYYNALVTRITEKQAAIEGALIYGDDNKAAALYQEASSLIDSLPQNTRSRQNQKQTLAQNLQQLKNRLRRLTEVANPLLFATLPAAEAQSWQLMTITDGSVFITSASKLIELSNSGKLTKTVDLPENFSLRQIFTLTNELLLVGQNNEAIIYNPSSGRQNQFDLGFNPIDASFYRDGLYFLSQEKRSIYRASKQGNSFARATLWLRAAQGELPKAVSLTVDGSIYVANPDNISKFSRGQNIEFTLSAVNPPLSAVSKIYTSSDTDYLYLWESHNNRLVVFDKLGKLIIQLTFPRLQTVSDMAVDGQNKVIYLLSDGKVYRTPILSATTE